MQSPRSRRTNSAAALLLGVCFAVAPRIVAEPGDARWVRTPGAPPHYAHVVVPMGDASGETPRFFAWLTEPGGAPEPEGTVRAVFARRTAGGWELHVRGWPAVKEAGAADLVVRVETDGATHETRLRSAVLRAPERLDLVLLVDDSYSMRRTDPARLRVEAARLFASIAAAHAEIETVTLVAFNQRARLLLRPTSPRDTAAIEGALAGLVARGSTDLDAAFVASAAALDALPPSRKVAVVLSDGRDEPGRYTEAHRLFLQRRWPVHTVGLSTDTDRETLQRIADESGGRHHFAPESSELPGIFRTIAEEILGVVRLAHWQTNPETPLRFPVDDTVRVLNVGLGGNARSGAGVSLHAPDGLMYALSAGQDALRRAEFFAPPRGEWEAVSIGRESDLLDVTATSELELVPFPLPVAMTAGVPVEVACVLAQGDEGVRDARVYADMGAERWPLAGGVADDGAVDRVGLYRGTIVPTAAEGEGPAATVAIVAEGTTQAGLAFRRIARMPLLLVASPRAVARPAPPPPAPEPVVEPPEPPPEVVAAPPPAPPEPPPEPEPAPEIPEAVAVEEPIVEPPAAITPAEASEVPRPAPDVDAVPAPQAAPAVQDVRRWPERLRWLRPVLLLLLLVLLFALLAWLLGRWLRAHPMARYLLASLACHAVLFLVAMQVLIETEVIQLEKVAPGMAVRVRALEQSLGIELTPPGPPVAVQDQPSALATGPRDVATPDVRDPRPAAAEPEVTPAQLVDAAQPVAGESAPVPLASEPVKPLAATTVPEESRAVEVRAAPQPLAEAPPQVVAITPMEVETAETRAAMEASLTPLVAVDASVSEPSLPAPPPAETVPETATVTRRVEEVAPVLPTEAPDVPAPRPAGVGAAPAMPRAARVDRGEPAAAASRPLGEVGAAPTPVGPASVAPPTAVVRAAVTPVAPGNTDLLPSAAEVAAMEPEAFSQPAPRRAVQDPDGGPMAALMPDRPSQAATDVVERPAARLAGVRWVEDPARSPEAEGTRLDVEAPVPAAAAAPVGGGPATRSVPAQVAVAPREVEAVVATRFAEGVSATAQVQDVDPGRPAAAAASTGTRAPASALAPQAATLATPERTPAPSMQAARAARPVEVAMERPERRVDALTGAVDGGMAAPEQAPGKVLTASIEGPRAAGVAAAAVSPVGAQRDDAPGRLSAAAQGVAATPSVVPGLATRPAELEVPAVGLGVSRLTLSAPAPGLPDADLTTATVARQGARGAADDPQAQGPRVASLARPAGPAGGEAPRRAAGPFVSPPGAASRAQLEHAFQSVQPELQTGGLRSHLTFSIGGANSGRATATLGLARYGGDWDSSPTAIPFLCHQLRERTGMALDASDRVVGLDDPELMKLPFVYMTGHRDFQFTDAERENLRRYLEGGGYLWADDSTHFGDETFDTAFRREILRVLPGAKVERLGTDLPLFRTGYDLTGGYKGFAIPPGDKYRQDFIEGIRVGDRLAVVYTRNDYGDGLNIDPLTHPLMPSLTDLDPAEMQEGAVRMGVNMVLNFLTHGGQVESTFLHRAATALRATPDATRPAPPSGPTRPLGTLADAAGWTAEDWGDPTLLAADGAALRMTFARGAQEKAAASMACDPPVALSAVETLALDVESRLRGGARVALGLAGGGGAYYETEPFYVRPGANTAHFRLGATTFKSEASGWEYRDRLPADFVAERITVLLYAPMAGEVALRNLRVIAAGP